MQAPRAKKIPYQHELHGDVRPDEYYWLRERDNPEVIAYLEDENRYYKEQMTPLEPLTEALFQAMVKRVPDVEAAVPVQLGDYFYYSRMEKALQYPIYARKRAATRAGLDTAAEEVLLDLNTMVTDGGYLDVTVQTLNDDQTLLAYLENRDGTDRYTAFVKDLRSGEMLRDQIDNVFIDESLEWDATGRYLFYIRVDHTQRPFQLWRHELGSSTDSDTLIYEETDATYGMRLSKSQSGAYLFLHTENKETFEIRYLKADEPTSEWRVFDARRANIQYDLEHWGDSFLILTNEDAPNFKLLSCPVTDTSNRARTEVIPHDLNRYLLGVHPFVDAIIVSGRENGLTELWTLSGGALSGGEQSGQALAKLTWDEPVYRVGVGSNLSFDTAEALIVYESLLTPRTTIALDLKTGAQTVLQVAEVPGEYDRAAYVQERLWATADDGTKVPLYLAYRKGTLDHGPAPLRLSGYGSYGIDRDPRFSAASLPLLDAGIVLATAQVRGGGEMGRRWYDEGKFLHKKNTFTDFVAVAKHLIARGYTTSDRIAAQGGSAGGLLMGAVANIAGTLFKVITADVPFVDVVTTMLDESIPLTTLEWDEWGNPNDPTYYAYMKSYSPYDNVEAKPYPHMLVTTGLTDPRVSYWEPAKWVARLRATKTDQNTLLMTVNMGAGHFGASGRLDALREAAEHLAFALDKIGITAAMVR